MDASECAASPGTRKVPFPLGRLLSLHFVAGQAVVRLRGVVTEEVVFLIPVLTLTVKCRLAEPSLDTPFMTLGGTQTSAAVRMPNGNLEKGRHPYRGGFRQNFQPHGFAALRRTCLEKEGALSRLVPRSSVPIRDPLAVV